MSRKSMSDSPQSAKTPTDFSLGPLGTINQVIKALGKTIRAMADDTIDSQKGARICNGLGIMRACLETKMLAELEEKMDETAREAVERAVARRQPGLPEGSLLQ